jgi:hypothetical protein
MSLLFPLPFSPWWVCLACLLLFLFFSAMILWPTPPREEAPAANFAAFAAAIPNLQFAPLLPAIKAR